MTKFQRWTLMTLLLICVALALMPFEAMFGQQLTAMLTTTLAVYAIARGLNAVISMAQGTELSIEPMGVGVTLTPGEILDPLNDLIEQVSTILLIASASLGIQKIVVGLGDVDVLRWILAGLSLLTLIIFSIKPTGSRGQNVLFKVVLVLTLIRCVVPIMAVTSNQLQSWLTVDRQQAVSVLMDTQQNVEVLNHATGKERHWYDGIKDSFDINASIEAIETKSEQAIEASVYILAEFVLVFVLMPILLLMLWMTLIKKLLQNVFISK